MGTPKGQSATRSKPATSITHQAVIVGSHQKVEWLIEHLRRPASLVIAGFIIVVVALCFFAVAQLARTRGVA